MGTVHRELLLLRLLRLLLMLLLLLVLQLQLRAKKSAIWTQSVSQMLLLLLRLLLVVCNAPKLRPDELMLLVLRYKAAVDRVKRWRVVVTCGACQMIIV